MELFCFKCKQYRKYLIVAAKKIKRFYFKIKVRCLTCGDECEDYFSKTEFEIATGDDHKKYLDNLDERYGLIITKDYDGRN